MLDTNALASWDELPGGIAVVVWRVWLVHGDR